MAKKRRKFADDGWAIWIEGDDTSTVYINDWLNPKGKSYVDLAIRIRGVKSSKSLNVYTPFVVTSDEIEDVSLLFEDKNTDGFIVLKNSLRYWCADPFILTKEEKIKEAAEILSSVPRTTPQRLDFLSGQLFANAVYVSDSSHELFMLRDQHEQQNYISASYRLACQ